MSVGKNIRAIRKRIGMSAETLAEMVELSPSTIYRYESGDIEKVDSAMIPKIAGALNTTPGEIMGWDESEFVEDPEMPSPDEWKLLHGLRSIPSARAKRIMEWVLEGIDNERNDDDDPKH